MLPNLTPRTGCPRLLLNLDPAGTIGVKIPRVHTLRAHRHGSDSDGNSEEDEPSDEWEEEEEPWADDVVHLGHCDASVRELCDLLGWREELERAWKDVGGGISPDAKPDQDETTPGKSAGGPPISKPVVGRGEGEKAKDEGDKNSSVQETMDKIVHDMEATLNISPNTGQSPEGGSLTDAAPQSLRTSDSGPHYARDPGTHPTTTTAAVSTPPPTDRAPEKTEGGQKKNML